MSENSSSINESNALLQLSPVSSSHVHCYVSGVSFFISTTYMITRIFLLLPLSVFILYHGHAQWWQNRSTATISHSNCFTYHLVTMELIGVLGHIICCCGIYTLHLKIITVGNYLSGFTWYGEIYFQMLTCVEHYLAVCHPITFLSLKNEKGIRIRNVSIGCVWILCFVAEVCVMMNQFFIMDLCILVLAVTVVSVCSFTVLCVLFHRGPGEKVRKRTDQSKQKAFHTIVAIWGVLLLRFVCDIVWEVLYMSDALKACVILTSISWSILPSSLVLPLLYLQKAGKIVCCKTDLQTKISSETRKQ